MRKRHKFQIETVPSNEIKLQLMNFTGKYVHQYCMNIWEDPINVYWRLAQISASIDKKIKSSLLLDNYVIYW